MKRCLIIIFLIFFTTIMSSCSSHIQEDNIRLQLNFKSEAKIISKGITANAKISRDSEGTTQLEITAPESLKGLKIKRDKVETSISKKGLVYKSDSEILLNSSPFLSIINILNYMEEKQEMIQPYCNNDKSIIFSGDIDSVKFELCIQKNTNRITEIKIGKDTIVKLDNYSSST